MKNFFRHKSRIVFAGAAFLILTASCEKEYFQKPPAPPPPKVGVQTNALEATFVTAAPMKLTDAYWKGADFIKVPVSDLSKNNLYPDGYLNMTGTYGGTGSFNNGSDPKVTMKAAYDDKKLYVYVEWLDNNINPAFAASVFNGPADPLKNDNADGWTAQGNSDKMALAFDIQGASGDAGTFSQAGCAASCHNGKMQTTSGSVDIWAWDLATSDALGYAADMVCDATNGLANDAGGSMYGSNLKTPGDPRSGPAFEWDGEEQLVTRPDGSSVDLDPGYFLVKKTPFSGDPAKGKNVYHNESGANCKLCHYENAGAFAAIGFARKFSRSGLQKFASDPNHVGQVYWDKVPPADIDDLIAYIKGIGTVPGVYLQAPTGSHADVWSVSNVKRSAINAAAPHTLYQVILIRDLSTSNADDIQFTTPEGKSFPFGIALMNGDGKNHIGSLKQTLTFKPKTL